MKMGITKTSGRLVKALPGTHERIVETALRYVSPGARALDLGAGSGALAERLRTAGMYVTGADLVNYFEIDAEFVQLDLNDPAFERALSSKFDLITSVEVIEHLENPTAFLRSIQRLLNPKGVAILTTPNVENVAARLKFLVTGEVRAMNKNSPEHVTPIYLDLFIRKIVPPSGLTLIDHFEHPKNDYPLTARRYFVPFFRMLAPFMKGAALAGDCHFLVLRKTEAQKPASNQ
jgi:SAM-dependent methyltransferase